MVSIYLYTRISFVYLCVTMYMVLKGVDVIVSQRANKYWQDGIQQNPFSGIIRMLASPDFEQLLQISIEHSSLRNIKRNVTRSSPGIRQKRILLCYIIKNVLVELFKFYLNYIYILTFIILGKLFLHFRTILLTFMLYSAFCLESRSIRNLV